MTRSGVAVESALDDPVWTALTGPQVHLAERHGQAARYRTDVAPFAAVGAGSRAWADLRELAGPGAVAVLTATSVPSDWEIVEEIPGVQLVDHHVTTAVAPSVVRLSAADVPEMLALVAATRPGPFLSRTIELGTFLGIRDGGTLVAMAGERLRLPGWTEISAVCTAPSHQGRGFATAHVRVLVAGIRARGERAFLHAAASNTGAVRLYESLGFQVRARPDFTAVRVPA